MPDTFRRRERGEGNGSGRTPGHERASRPSPPPSRPPLPRDVEGLPELGDAFWRLLDGGLAALPLELAPGARAAIDRHARLLLAWNQSINLTALRTAEQVARLHVLDGLAAQPTCRQLLERAGVEAGAARILDLGSGGGYPGLPVAITLGGGHCALVDSVRKKADFLAVAAAAVEGALRAAGEPVPQFTVLAERAEDLADEPDQREGWHLVLARAVGSLAEVAELALPLLRIGGHLVAWKRSTAREDGTGLADELRAARRVIQAAGGSRPRVVRAPSAEALGLAGHVLVIVPKVRPTPDRYPRPPGERRKAALLR